MKAVILAGGLGTRLKPFTETIPKPLLPIGEKAILEIQIERLKKYEFNEIFLATNYKSEYIESFFGDGSKYGVKLYISKEDKPLGTVGLNTITGFTLMIRIDDLVEYFPKEYKEITNYDMLKNIYLEKRKIYTDNNEVLR